MKISATIILYIFIGLLNVTAQENTWKEYAIKCKSENDVLIKKLEKLQRDSISLKTEIVNQKIELSTWKNKYIVKGTELTNYQKKQKIINDNLKMEIEEFKYQLKSLVESNLNLSKKIELLNKLNIAQEKLIAQYEDDKQKDSIEIIKLNNELFRRSIKAVNFEIFKENKSDISKIEVTFELVDMNDQKLLPDTFKLNMKILEFLNTPITFGDMGQMYDKQTKILEIKDVLNKVKTEFISTNNFTKRKIQNNNYIIAIYYDDVLIGMNQITKENIKVK